MDIDDEYVRNKFLSPYRTWEQDFSEVNDKYLAIILKAEELAKYKAARRDDQGGGISGGGLGLEGAAAGMAIATAANVAIGVVGGVLNLGASALNAMGDGLQKWTLYKAPETKNHLAESVYRLVIQVHFALVDVADQYHKDIFEKVSEEDKVKAKSLFVNISKGRITGEEAEGLLIESIALNPFEPASYLLWLNLYGDADGHLSNVAEHFGIRDISDRKRQMLLQHKETLKVSTIEECEASLIDLENYADKIGYQDIAGERTSIVTVIDRLKLEQRTFSGVVYETQEAAQVQKETVQAQKEELRKTVDGVHYSSREEADEIRAKRKNVSFFLGLSIFILPLPNALLTLQSGYSIKARLLANIWLAVFSIFIFFSSEKSDVGPLIIILLITLFGLLVMPIRIVLDSILGQIKEGIKEPSSDSAIAPSTSIKSKAIESKKVKLWFIAVVALFILIGLLAPTDKKIDKEPVAPNSTEIVEPIAEANMAKMVTDSEVDAVAPNNLQAEKSGEEVFKAVCSMCHTAGLMNAPKIGDKAQWAPRIAQGYDLLVNHAINGIRTMPARGGNPSLTDGEVANAVAYMANESGADFK
jgi:cytochrome c5